MGERLARGRAERAVDVAAAPPLARVERPAGPAGGPPGAVGLDARSGADEPPAGVGPGDERPHLVEVDDDGALGRGGVEPIDGPLFSANAGSTRSPNQPSCCRQRRPSARRISSIRLRLIPMPLALR